MFKAIRTIKKIKQLQKAMHDASVAFLLMQDLGLIPDGEKSRARAKSFHDMSHMLQGYPRRQVSRRSYDKARNHS